MSLDCIVVTATQPNCNTGCVYDVVAQVGFDVSLLANTAATDQALAVTDFTASNTQTVLVQTDTTIAQTNAATVVTQVATVSADVTTANADTSTAQLACVQVLADTGNCVGDFRNFAANVIAITGDTFNTGTLQFTFGGSTGLTHAQWAGAGIGTIINLLGTAIVAANTDAGVANTDVNNVKGDIQTANTAVNTLTTEAATANTAINTVQTQVTALLADLATLKTAMAQVTADITNISSAVNYDVTLLFNPNTVPNIADLNIAIQAIQYELNASGLIPAT